MRYTTILFLCCSVSGWLSPHTHTLHRPTALSARRSNNNTPSNLLLSSLLSLSLIFAPSLAPPPAAASDGLAIASCLFEKCPGYLAKCVANPMCLANVVCINTCNGAKDETGCQIKCGDIFDNPVIGEFNKCAVSDMSCVPKKLDDNSYPSISPENTVPSFDTSFFTGKWYITAGQNKLFDTFPCQVHFFEPTSKNSFVGKLNWRVVEPDGETMNRNAVQSFVQSKEQPGLLMNHDNDFLHYQDDWYVIDYEPDYSEKNSPFAFVYYRGSNDAWDGYGGVVVYTRDAKLPDDIRPRLEAAARKVGFDFGKDFVVTDNTCRDQTDSERLVLKETFLKKEVLLTEEALQANAVRGSRFVVQEEKALEKQVGKLEKAALKFEQSLVEGVEEKANDVEVQILKGGKMR